MVASVLSEPDLQEIDAQHRDRKDSTRTPARKNRRYLSTTVEEDGDAPGTRSRSNSVSPPLLPTSPGPEMKLKVRQISQGVEDLNWRPQLPTHCQKDEEMHEGEVQKEPTTDLALEGDKEDAEIAEISTPEERPSPPDIQMSKSVPNMEKSQDIGHAVQPDVMADSDATGPSASRPRSHSDGADKDKAGLKRKHSERGTSQAPPEAEEQLKDSEGLKRPRDEAEGEENPHETKRPTPPPESKSGRTSPPSPKVPKLVRILRTHILSTLTDHFVRRADSWLTPHQALHLQMSRGRISSHPSQLPLLLRCKARVQPRQFLDRGLS